MKNDDLFYEEVEPEKKDSPEGNNANPYGSNGNNGEYNDGNYNNGNYNNNQSYNNSQNYDNNQSYNNQNYNNNYDPNGNYSNGNYNNGGTPPYGYKKSNGLAIASLILGLLSVICCWTVYLSPVFAICGIITACLSKKRQPFTGMAIAGLILSILGLIIFIGMILMVVYVMTNPELVKQMQDYMEEYTGSTLPYFESLLNFFR